VVVFFNKNVFSSVKVQLWLDLKTKSEYLGTDCKRRGKKISLPVFKKAQGGRFYLTA